MSSNAMAAGVVCVEAVGRELWQLLSLTNYPAHAQSGGEPASPPVTIMASTVCIC